MRVHYMGYILHGGLDVKAERRHEEVQKGRASMADWTLKRREGMLKSKRDEKTLNCTPCQGHDGYNYLPNFYPANKGFIPVFVY